MLQPCSSVCLYIALRDTSAHTEGYIAIPRSSLFKRVVPEDNIVLYVLHEPTILPHTEGYIAIPRLSLFKRVVPADNIVLYVLHESTILPCFAGMLQPFLFDCSSV